MKKSSVEKLTRQSADQSVTQTKPNPTPSHAIAFFEYLRLPGMPFAEAGPAAVVVPCRLSKVEAIKESVRIIAGMPSPFAMGARIRCKGTIQRITLDPYSDAEREQARDEMAREMTRAGLTQAQFDASWDRDFELSAAAHRDVGRIVKASLQWETDSSIRIIVHAESWDRIDLTTEGIGNMLAAIYGRGAVYRYNPEVPRSLVKGVKRKAAALAQRQTEQSSNSAK